MAQGRALRRKRRCRLDCWIAATHLPQECASGPWLASGILITDETVMRLFDLCVRHAIRWHPRRNRPESPELSRTAALKMPKQFRRKFEHVVAFFHKIQRPKAKIHTNPTKGSVFSEGFFAYSPLKERQHQSCIKNQQLPGGSHDQI